MKTASAASTSRASSPRPTRRNEDGGGWFHSLPPMPRRYSASTHRGGAHGPRLAAEHGLHHQPLHDAHKERGRRVVSSSRRDLPLAPGLIQQLQQQLAISLQHSAHLGLGGGFGGLLQFLKDETRHAGVADDKGHVGVEDRLQRLQRRGGTFGRGLQAAISSWRTHTSPPARWRPCWRKCLNTAPLRHPHGGSDVVRGDLRRAGVARQRQCGAHDGGLARFSGQSGLHAACSSGKLLTTYHCGSLRVRRQDAPTGIRACGRAIGCAAPRTGAHAAQAECPHGRRSGRSSNSRPARFAGRGQRIHRSTLH
jgi:hypothetical protein